MSENEISQTTDTLINEFQQAIDDLAGAAIVYINNMDIYSSTSIKDASIIKDKIIDKLTRYGLLDD